MYESHVLGDKRVDVSGGSFLLVPYTYSIIFEKEKRASSTIDQHTKQTRAGLDESKSRFLIESRGKHTITPTIAPLHPILGSHILRKGGTDHVQQRPTALLLVATTGVINSGSCSPVSTGHFCYHRCTAPLKDVHRS